MLSPKQIQALLKDRRLDILAAATGLHPNTIRAIRDGTTKEPSFSTIEVLSRYLERQCADGGHG